MEVTYRNLDRLAKRKRLIRALGFKAPLSDNYSETYLLVIWYLDRNGVEQSGVVRAQRTLDVRCFRSVNVLEKLIARWRLPGMYVSILEATGESNRREFLTDEDWKFVLKTALLPNLAEEVA